MRLIETILQSDVGFALSVCGAMALIATFCHIGERCLRSESPERVL